MKVCWLQVQLLDAKKGLFGLMDIFQADTYSNLNNTIALAYLKAMNKKSAFNVVQKGQKKDGKPQFKSINVINTRAIFSSFYSIVKKKSQNHNGLNC